MHMIRITAPYCSWRVRQQVAVSLHLGVYLHEVLATPLRQARHADWCKHGSRAVVDCLERCFHCTLTNTQNNTRSTDDVL